MSSATTKQPGEEAAGDSISSAPAPQTSATYGMEFSSLPKPAPDNLMEELNTPSFKTGASIAVVSNKPQNRGELAYLTNKFYLSAMQIPYQEKAQVLETFGAAAVSFLGQRAIVYSFSGLLIDWPSGDVHYSSMQGSSMIKLYQEHLRGTKLVENDQIGIIRVLNHLIYGYPLSFQTSYNAGSDKTQSFSMSWVVTDHQLAMPGMFTEEDLKKNYLPGYQDPQKAQLLQTIDAFVEEFNKAVNIKVPVGGDDRTINLVSTTPQQWSRWINSIGEFKSQFEKAATTLIDLLDPQNTNKFKELTSSIGARSYISQRTIEKAKSSGGIDTLDELEVYHQLIKSGNTFMGKLNTIKTNLLL